jgi:hypothetical protein
MNCFHNQTVFSQLFKSERKHAWVNSFNAMKELVKATGVATELMENEDNPLAADEIDSFVDVTRTLRRHTRGIFLS